MAYGNSATLPPPPCEPLTSGEIYTLELHRAIPKQSYMYLI